MQASEQEGRALSLIPIAMVLRNQQGLDSAHRAASSQCSILAVTVLCRKPLSGSTPVMM